jgi:hypothetical protein
MVNHICATGAWLTNDMANQPPRFIVGPTAAISHRTSRWTYGFRPHEYCYG